MARPTDTARRADLLQGTIRYAAEHGLANLSLRPLAAYLGTSSRMLIHYFATREHLLDQALAAAQPDIPSILSQHAEAGHSPQQMAALLWHDLVRSGEQESNLRLLLQVMTLALTQPETYADHARRAIRTWVDSLADALRQMGIPDEEAAAKATLLISGLRGLALDRYVTGDVRRTDGAAADLIAAGTLSISQNRGGPPGPAPASLPAVTKRPWSAIDAPSQAL